MTSISIIAYGVYTYLVTDFLDPFALLHLNWSVYLAMIWVLARS